MHLIGALALCGAIGLLVWIAICDFRTLTIRNRYILILIALYVPTLFYRGFESLPSDLIAAAVLFVIGFISWELRMIGGGDVKLFFALGLYLGYDGLGAFCLLLLVFSLVALLGLALVRKFAAPEPSSYIMQRLKVITAEQKLPYGVILIGASLPPIVAGALTLG